MQNAEKTKAAQLKMFGRLTRETSEWVPARLLCVRFNVKNPFADDKADTGPKKKKPPSFDSAELFSKLEEPRGGGAPAGEEDGKDGEDTAGRKPLSVTMAASVKEEEEEMHEKPPMDLFKAIFANSDSESSEEEEEGDGDGSKREERAEKVPTLGKAAEGEPSSKPREAPRGIFANIDFDALNRRTRRNSPPPLVKEKVATTKPKSVLDQSVRTLLGIKNPR